MRSRGPCERVPASFESVFDWRYALEQESLLTLYEKGKAATWNAADLDWSIEVDLEKMISERAAGVGPADAFNQLLAPPRPLEPREALELNLNMNAWMLSQFLHGEQGALLATAKIVQCAPDEESKWYAANQVADEARHVEVYHRYLTEKLGRSFEVNPHLQTLLDEIISDPRWDMTYLGMQIMVEGLALAAFGLMKLQMPDEPLIQEITMRIMGDESRHVAFGVLALENLYRNELNEAELREREDFVIEATYLMRSGARRWPPASRHRPTHRSAREFSRTSHRRSPRFGSALVPDLEGTDARRGGRPAGPARGSRRAVPGRDRSRHRRGRTREARFRGGSTPPCRAGRGAGRSGDRA